MVRTFVRTALAAAALGSSALAAGFLLLQRDRLERWETLSCDDCEEGEFFTLADGTRMHYVTRGDPTRGDDIILIHGLMSSTSEWSKNMDALAQEHRVWAIDLIGFGYSSRVVDPVYSLKYLARSVQELMDARGIARAHLVGHSLGGAIALQLAHDSPNRVNRLVLVDPAAYIFGLLRPVRLAVHVPLLPRTLGAWFLTNPRVHRTALRNALGDPGRLDAEMLAARVRATRVKGTCDALIAMAASRDAANLPEGLAKIQSPALILWGDRDYVLPLHHGQRLVRDLPNAELVILEGAGHVPNEEFPEVVNRLILDFFGKEETVGGRTQ